MHAGDGADQGSLAGAVGADDRHDLPRIDRQRHAVERLRIAMENADVLDVEHHNSSAPR